MGNTIEGKVGSKEASKCPEYSPEMKMFMQTYKINYANFFQFSYYFQLSKVNYISCKVNILVILCFSK